MDGNEIINRVKEVIEYIKKNDHDRAILYLKYILEDIEMYKKNSL